MGKMGVKFCVLAVLLSMLLIPVVQATAYARAPPTAAEGTWTYIITDFKVIKQVGGNTFVSAEETGTWTGTFIGTSKMVVSGVIHSDGLLTFHGLIYFEGTVGGVDGTLVIRYSGKVMPTGELTGHWVIQSGTGDLVNLRGRGTLGGLGYDLTYSGQVHFKPN